MSLLRMYFRLLIFSTTKEYLTSIFEVNRRYYKLIKLSFPIRLYGKADNLMSLLLSFKTTFDTLSF